MGSVFSAHIVPRWLKIKEAARYSAIGVKRLKELANDGLIAGGPDPDSGRGDWIFDRLSLDRYRQGQLGLDAVDEAVNRLEGINGSKKAA